ncbi:MAG: glycoside hydrolase family 2 protein [Anaerolineae bacterium]|nr:glycoside hydrolase family 2 protein [Anaerolineae bacterium]
MDLNGTWKLNDFAPGDGLQAGAPAPGYDDSNWTPVSVPGDVHTALIAAGRIDDPFYSTNETACAWIEEREWWYRTTFTVEELAPDMVERLIFYGLDTFAVVYLNGELLGEHVNMFRAAVFDVTGRIQYGEPNTLAVRFDPPLQRVADKPDVPGAWGRNFERVWMRKAQFGYGWDWGPRLPTVGIWREVELQRCRYARIASVQFRTEVLDLEENRALVAVRVEVERLAGDLEPVYARVILTPRGASTGDTTRAVHAETVKIYAKRVTLRMEIKYPDVWWTHDLGKPACYDLSVRLHDENEDNTLDLYETRVGIRTIELDQSPDTDEPGTRFFRFVLNGVPIFAKGANWIPAHSFVGAIDEAHYRMLLECARDANMNMLRIWGGGIYEKPDFYNLCDRLGILVWQDFMFACAPYPEDDDFTAEVEAEARDVALRLRNHPCLALWCGNNENQWIDEIRNWQSPRPVPGARFYHEVLPAVVAELDPTRPYWPGSPYGGSDYDSMDDGDRHNWCVWHGNQDERRRFGEPPSWDHSPAGVSFLRYADDLGRFISEFGMHAAPVMETLRRNIPPDGLSYHSAEMDHRNKDNPKNKGDNLMLNCTGLPEDLAQYIDFSMISQAEGLKFGVEHFRRRKPHCSGTLIWQLNDCWPGLSWSLLDFYGFGKAGYYYARRFYAPVIASFREEADGSVALWLINDSVEEIEDKITVRLARFDGAVHFEKTLPVTIGANRAAQVYRVPADKLAGARGPATYLGVASAGKYFPANRHFFVPIKDLERPAPKLDVDIEQTGAHAYNVVVAADVYAFFVKIETPYARTHFEDNYFDIEPGGKRAVRVYNDEEPLTAADIKVSCL